jgi:hypothetical protein
MRKVFHALRYWFSVGTVISDLVFLAIVACVVLAIVYL